MTRRAKMKAWLRLAMRAAGWWFAFSAPAFAASASITLDEVIARAKIASPAVQVALAQRTVAREGESVAAAAAFPVFGASVAGNTLAAAGSVWGGGVASAATDLRVLQAVGSVFATWRAFDFGQTSHAVSAARAGIAEGEAGLDRARDRAAARAAAAFLALTNVEDELAILRDALAAHERIWDVTRAQLARGFRSPVDETRARAEVERARASIEDASRRAHTLRIELKTSLGLEDEALAKLERPLRFPSNSPHPTNVTAARPDVRVAQLRAARLAEESEVAVSAQRPVIAVQGAAVGQWNRFATSVAAEGDAVQLERAGFLAGGVTVSVPLWDRALSARASLATARAQQATAEASEVERANALLRAEAASDFERASRMLETSERWSSAAAAVFAQAMDRYEHGVSSPLEISQAHAAWLDAKLAWLRTRALLDDAWVRRLLAEGS